jgi:hypothetical protein
MDSGGKGKGPKCETKVMTREAKVMTRETKVMTRETKEVPNHDAPAS